MISVNEGESLSLEDGKSYELENGVKLTANKVSESVSTNALEPPNGVWDYIGQSTFTNQSGVFLSTGGDIKINVFLNYNPGIFGTPYVLELRESDNLSSSLISRISIKDNGKWELSVSGYTDGSDGTAELFIRKLTYPGKSIHTTWYD